jgi:hypothetical protein
MDEKLPRRSAPLTYACPKCLSAMTIASVEPDGPDHEKRMFNCPMCNHIETVRVGYR